MAEASDIGLALALNGGILAAVAGVQSELLSLNTALAANGVGPQVLQNVTANPGIAARSLTRGPSVAANQAPFLTETSIDQDNRFLKREDSSLLEKTETTAPLLASRTGAQNFTTADATSGDGKREPADLQIKHAQRPIKRAQVSASARSLQADELSRLLQPDSRIAASALSSPPSVNVTVQSHMPRALATHAPTSEVEGDTARRSPVSQRTVRLPDQARQPLVPNGVTRPQSDLNESLFSPPELIYAGSGSHFSNQRYGNVASSTPGYQTNVHRPDFSRPAAAEMSFAGIQQANDPISSYVVGPSAERHSGAGAIFEGVSNAPVAFQKASGTRNREHPSSDHGGMETTAYRSAPQANENTSNSGQRNTRSADSAAASTLQTQKGESEEFVAGKGDQHIVGDVFLDGALIGRWMSRLLSKQIERASVGPTGYDVRRGRLLPGSSVGV